MNLIDGKKTADKRLKILRKEIDLLKDNNQALPCLAVILVGDDPASETYVKSKARQSKNVGIESHTIFLDKNISQEDLIKEINILNEDDSVNGILVQLPLPKHIVSQVIINSINPMKDVDGLHVENVGLLSQNHARFVPCTPKGIMTLLDEYEIDLSGKDALVIGRSQLVGNPIANLLKNKDMTVTQAHSKTKNLEEKIKNNELIVVAVGVREMIKKEMLSEHHIVIDVGIHRHDGKLYGDVDKDAYDKVKMITPVPKGVGPMTIVSLLENTLLAYQLQRRNHG